MYMFTESLFCICLQTWRGCIATTFILLIAIITTIIFSITKLILQNALVIVTSISSFVTSHFTYKLKETKLILKVNTVNCASVQYLTIKQRARVFFQQMVMRWNHSSFHLSYPHNHHHHKGSFCQYSCCWFYIGKSQKNIWFYQYLCIKEHSINTSSLYKK